MVTTKAKRELFAKKNVRVVYERNGKLFVGVTKKISELLLKAVDVVPCAIEGILTDVFEVGEINALSFTGKYRPAPGGVSIGHYNITAGTLGVVVKQNNQRLMLSNNHVLADSNSGQIGDVIIQPGPHDGGSIVDDRIGTLLKYVPINFGENGGNGGNGSCPFAKGAAGLLNLVCKGFLRKTRFQTYDSAPWKIEQLWNKVDCALAWPDLEEDVLDEIVQIGKPTAFGIALIGETVCKVGRTTEYTEGNVQAVDAMVQVGYGGGKVAYFEDQILTSNMLKGGDSGALLLKLDKKTAVGLSFAGSSQVSIHNHINDVKEALGEFSF